VRPRLLGAGEKEAGHEVMRGGVLRARGLGATGDGVRGRHGVMATGGGILAGEGGLETQSRVSVVGATGCGWGWKAICVVSGFR
jgi:hypothetical protein